MNNECDFSNARRNPHAKRLKRQDARMIAAAILCLSCLGVQGCSRETPERDASLRELERVQLSGMTEEQKLLLFEHIPLGTTSSEVRNTVPELGAVRLEQRSRGLTDAAVALDVLGHRTQVEFNFKNDTLYAVWLGSIVLPADSGDALFDRLTDFYQIRFGEPVADDSQDSPYFVRSRFWPTPWGEITVGNSLAGDRRILAWGYQPAVNTRWLPRRE